MEATMSHDEEAKAQLDIWKYIWGFTEMAVVTCAIDLEIPDILENHTGGMTLEELSAAVGCSVPASLHRVMRFLTHHGIFKQVVTDKQDSQIVYTQTALSRLLMKTRMAPVLKFSSSPVMISSLLGLSKFLTLKNGEYSSAFEVAHGLNVWEDLEANPSHRKLFNDAMACIARSVIVAVIENCRVVFEGIGSLVDVGGGDGTTVRGLVKACPWITRAINFDLPHMVSSSDGDDRVEHVGGDMFVAVPSADATLIMSVLHNWDDEACVKILKNCRAAIPKETGKAIIVDIVIDDDDNLNESNNKYRGVQLAFDMEMLIHTIGKQRTAKEWGNILHSAGFTKHTIQHISTLKSVIVAYP